MRFTFEHYHHHLKTGIGPIDDQHIELIQFLGGLLAQFSVGKAPERLDEPMEFLHGHLEKHFHAEEGAMRTLGYGDYNAHKAKHDEFLKYFHTVYDAFRAGGAVSERNRPDLQYIFHWLTNHIMEDDRRMAEFFRSKGGL